MTHSEVAILVVTHNSYPEIANCLRAALLTGAEVLVIDNASTDATAEAARQLGVSVISNSRNLGFSAAVNQGVRATNAPCLLLLNPDAAILGGIEHLAECCRDPLNGAAGGKLLNQEGVPQRGFNIRRFPSPLAISLECLMINRIWPANPVNWRYRCLGLSLDKPREVDQPAGAFLMFRRDVWHRLGGFDEGYFPIWFEDVDFCARVKRAGFFVRFNPQASAIHTGAHSVAPLSLEIRERYWYGSLLEYAAKHYGRLGRITTCLSIVLGSLLRIAVGGAKHRGADMLRTYYAVARLAVRSIRISKLEPGVILQ